MEKHIFNFSFQFGLQKSDLSGTVIKYKHFLLFSSLFSKPLHLEQQVQPYCCSV